MNATSATTENGKGMDGGSASKSGAAARFGAGFKGSRRDAETLRAGLSSLKEELDSLMSRAATMGEEELGQAYNQIVSQFSSMRHAARGMAAQASKQFKGGVDVTSGYVKDKPMQSVGVAAGIGLLLGMLIARS